MNFFRNPCILFLALSGALSTASAQEPMVVSVKIDVVAFGEDIPGIQLGEGGPAVIARGFQYSKPLSYKGPNVLEIHRQAGVAAPADLAGDQIPMLPALAERRKSKPTLVGLAILPAASRRVTILLAPGPSGTFQSIVLDDDPSKLPYGNMRIHNFSPNVIALSCNNQLTGEMKPKDSTVVPALDGRVSYVLKYLKEGVWKTQENNLLRVTPEEQVHFVVLQSTASFFRSGSGVRSGFLQIAVLRRNLKEPVEADSPTE